MKRFFTLLCVVVGWSASAQITIENFDFRLPIAPDTAYLQVVSAGNSTISPGTNENWDMSGVFPGPEQNYALEPVSNSSIPNSAGRFEFEVDLGGLILEKFYNHYGADSDGYYQAGFQIEGKKYGLGVFTGDISDTLITMDTIQPSNIPILQFPLEYGDHWSSQSVIWIPMEMTIETLGWYDQIISLKQELYTNDTVVGWGMVTLPTGQSAEVLMVRHHSMRIDSTYSNGIPMDPVLAGNLGFAQGNELRQDRWALYGKGMNSSLYEYAEFDGVQGAPVFNRSMNIGVAENSITAVVVFPNPAHERIQIVSQNHGDVVMININGSIVKTASAEEWNGDMLELAVSDLPPGSYVVRVGEESIKVTLQ